MMMFNLKILEEYYTNGLLIKQTHPSLPLTIWNYSRECQYSKAWDSITLACRGLVLDKDGKVIAKPFPKFFNMEELSDGQIPDEPFDVYEKMDGSLGICFYYAGDWHMATRGSFVSEQSIRGRELLNKYNYKSGMYPGYTYLFEIIYKENRVVVDYDGYEGLVVLGAYDNKTGNEVSIDEMEYEGFDVVKNYNGISDFRQLKNMVADNAEGFVIRFKSGMRMKIKGEEYVRLHSIMSGISTIMIWETLSSGGSFEDILSMVPDEVADKIAEECKDLAIRFDNIRKDYIGYYADIVFKVGINNRAAFAENAKRYPHPSLLFLMLDGKNINPTIWKIIKPDWRKIF